MVVKVENGLYSAPIVVTQLSSKSSPKAKPSGSSSSVAMSAPAAQPSPSPPPTLPYREFCGNAKRITVETNCQHLRIVGNDNRIFVHLNVGRLEVLGNANRVRVLDNRRGGRISYVGNGGRVYLCGDAAVTGATPVPTSSESSDAVTSAVDVRYTGINGSVRLVSREELLKTLIKSDEELQKRRQQRRQQQQQQQPMRNGSDADCGGVPDATADTTASTTTTPNAQTSVNVTTSTSLPHQQRRADRQHTTTTVDDLSAKSAHFQRSLNEQICVSALNVSLGNLLDMDRLSATIGGRAAKSDLVINQRT